jgi:sugar (pentulose or hexulose) kinase
MLLFSADFGTSSLKAAVVDENGRQFMTVRRAYDLNMPGGDRVELDADEVYGAFLSAAREAFAAHPDIEGICFDAFAPSLVIMDEDGGAICPIITHLDRRSRKESRRIQELITPEDYLRETGVLPYAGGVSATSLLWISRNRDGLFKKASKAGHFTTYLFRRLTGQWGIDGVNASMTGLFATFSGGWSEKILGELGIPAPMLPPVWEPWDRPGALLGEVASAIGANIGIPVFMGTQDVSAAQVGAGNVRAGDALMTSGSSEMLSVLCDHPSPHEKYYVRRAATPGLWQAFAIGIGGFAIEWFRKTFCADMSEASFYNEYFPGPLADHPTTASVRFRPYLQRYRRIKRPDGYGNLFLLYSERRDLFRCSRRDFRNDAPDCLLLLRSRYDLSLVSDLNVCGVVRQYAGFNFDVAAVSDDKRRRSRRAQLVQLDIFLENGPVDGRHDLLLS